MASYWQALAQQSDHYLSLLAAGVALGELKEYKSAEAMLTGAIAMNPQTVIAYVQRATARREQSKIVLAQADIEEAKKRDPELALALLRRADEYRGNFQLDKALADYSEAIRLDPTIRRLRRTRCHLFASRRSGQGPGRLQRVPPARTRIRVGHMLVRAEIYRMKGDLDRALADANEAYSSRPELRMDLSVSGQDLWPPRRVGQSPRRLERSDPPRSEGRWFSRRPRGNLPGSWENARRPWPITRKAIRLDPKHVWGYWASRPYYRDNGDLDKALAAYDEAVRIAPQYRSGYHFFGPLFTRTAGDFEKALADYNEAIRLSPNDPGVWLQRAAPP